MSWSTGKYIKIDVRDKVDNKKKKKNKIEQTGWSRIGWIYWWS